MKLLYRSIVALSAATLAAGAANAATQVSTYSFGYAADGSYAPTPTDVNNNFVLAGFDTSLGTLTDVVLSYGYRVTTAGDFTLTSSGTSSNTANVTAGVNSNGIISFSDPDYSQASLTASATKYTPNAVVGQQYSISSNSQLMTDSQDIFANYLAGSAIAGNFLSQTASTVSIFPQGGNANTNLTSKASGYVTATYTYTAAAAAVPEPASWAMMVGGFGMLGGALRRKKANISFA